MSFRCGKNRHASGITVVLEATLLGKPVVVADTGGIDWYFTRDEVVFCPVGMRRCCARRWK